MASTTSRLSLSPTPPSPSSRRSRRKLHDLAPKTLKSQARLSTLHARSDEPEARRRRIIAGREAARRSRRTQCARRSSRLVPLPLYARGRNDDGLGGAGLALRGCAPRSLREALISSPAPPPPAQRGWRFLGEGDVGLEAPAAGEFYDPLEQERRRLLLAHPLFLRLRHRDRDALLDHRLLEGLILGDRVRDQEAAGADVALEADHGGKVAQASVAMLETEARRTSIEGGELV